MHDQRMSATVEPCKPPLDLVQPLCLSNDHDNDDDDDELGLIRLRVAAAEISRVD